MAALLNLPPGKFNNAAANPGHFETSTRDGGMLLNAIQRAAKELDERWKWVVAQLVTHLAQTLHSSMIIAGLQVVPIPHP